MTREIVELFAGSTPLGGGRLFADYTGRNKSFAVVLDTPLPVGKLQTTDYVAGSKRNYIVEYNGALPPWFAFFNVLAANALDQPRNLPPCQEGPFPSYESRLGREMFLKMIVNETARGNWHLGEQGIALLFVKSPYSETEGV